MPVNFQSYFICTSPRSGSTLLCHLLRDTQIAGCPNSHFHEPSLEAWCTYYALSLNDFPDDITCLRGIFDAALKVGRGGTDIFGQRLQQESFDYFLSQVTKLNPDAETNVAGIENIFGRTLFIHLTRQAKLDQAISLEIALQSGLWHRRGDGTELERQAPHQTPTYNATAICEHIGVAQKKEQAWLTWFETQAITPLQVTYEALSAAPFATRNRILGALGRAIDDTRQNIAPTAKLADDTSRQWALKFRDDHPNLATSNLSVAFQTP